MSHFPVGIGITVPEYGAGPTLPLDLSPRSACFVPTPRKRCIFHPPECQSTYPAFPSATQLASYKVWYEGLQGYDFDAMDNSSKHKTITTLIELIPSVTEVNY